MDNQTTADRINRDFTYHPPTPAKAEKHQAVRDAAKELAVLVMAVVPASREQSLAMTKIEEAVMWANAGIARHE